MFAPILKLNIVKFNIMKVIEIIKFICGLTLVSFPILAGLIFYLESFNILAHVLPTTNISPIFKVYTGDAAAISNTSIFLGLCGLAGAYLLASVKSVKNESKTEFTSNQSNKEV
jgi:uncharacterized membrane protein YuzA (DUF378 family)